ncbi:MAG: response regulator [Synergistaceae bacterium]|nr:response regulator [Synergistaceae bacterium]
MRVFIADEDKTVIEVLTSIVEEKCLGEVCGFAENRADALKEIEYVSPDIVIADLMMPARDGVDLVRAAKERFPNVRFIILSQVSEKEAVSKAYKAGAEFYIQKPVDVVEVSNVIAKVNRSRQIESVLDQLRSVIQAVRDLNLDKRDSLPENQDSCTQRMNVVLQKLGISGSATSRDICRIALYLAECGGEGARSNLSDLCAMFSDNPKTLEQRIRRTIASGLVNLASIGVEDYGNEAFVDYAGTLYQFEQVRAEMNFIKGRTKERGSVSVKRFLYALASICQNK